MRLERYLFAATILLAAAPAIARPVSYFEGTAIMVENRRVETEWMATYTFHPEISAGIHLSELRYDGRKENYGAAALNWLVFRKSRDQWQSNLYLGGGAGARRDSNGGRRGAMGVAFFEADAESRKLYFSVRAESVGLGLSPRTYARARAGFAPYLSEINGLHTWVVLEADREPLADSISITPLLRFFYQNVLFEGGASFGGDFRFNFTVEF